jgi:membrane protease YdiL (CAAX protease family)
MSPASKQLFQQIVLSLGAGIYEEFVFRVVMITGIASLLGFVFQWEATAKNAGGVLIAAGIFSMFHFVGEFGDNFSINLFMIRFLAGILLGLVYAFRGFGIAAYTHAMYDLVVLTVITTSDS